MVRERALRDISGVTGVGAPRRYLLYCGDAYDLSVLKAGKEALGRLYVRLVPPPERSSRFRICVVMRYAHLRPPCLSVYQGLIHPSTISSSS